MVPPPGVFFAHQESLRCQLLRELVRRGSLSRERTPDLDESTTSQEELRPDSSESVTPVTPATPATVEAETCTPNIEPYIPKTEPNTPKADSVTPNIEPVTSKVETTTPEAEPKAEPTMSEAEFPMPEADPMDSEDEAPWQYPKKAWRQNPIIKRYEDEAFIFIRADSFPTDPEATVPLIGWLRMHDKLCAPSKPLHSGVVRVEKVGWTITLGHDSGAMDRMILLLERKAGQNFMFKGKMHKITMDTHMPLDEWMP